MHFIPTAVSWLNLVERWFQETRTSEIRLGVFQSVPELIDAIMAYIEKHNEGSDVVRMDGQAERIIRKSAPCARGIGIRVHQTLETLH